MTEANTNKFKDKMLESIESQVKYVEGIFQLVNHLSIRVGIIVKYILSKASYALTP